MKKLIFVILGLLIFIFILKNENTPYVTINKRAFEVYVAKTDEQKEKGLAIVKSLPENKGMIFPFSKSDYYAFWMKDMKFPIDIIYIDKGKIVYIFRDVPSPKSSNQILPVYKPNKKANYVLEINAGLSKKYNFKINDRVRINI